VIEQRDQFQKFGKTLALKYQFFKEIKKSDLHKKIGFFYFFKSRFFQPCLL